MKRGLPVLIILCAIAGLTAWFFLRQDSRDNALATRELATRTLAEYLARQYPGQRALLVSNPFTQNDDATKEVVAMEKAGIAGIQKGLGTKVTLEAIVFPELKPEARANPRAILIDNETTTPISYLVTESAFDQLVARHPNCDLLVSLVGLPATLNQAQCWHTAKPKFALLLPDLRLIGPATAVKQAMHKGKLAAFVLNKPRAPDLHSPLKQNGEFDKRFLLVTPENIESVIASYPQLFPAN
jgi:hypothetical protein